MSRAKHDKAMQDYLSALLSEDMEAEQQVLPTLQAEPVARLLEQASLRLKEAELNEAPALPSVEPVPAVAPTVEPEPELDVEHELDDLSEQVRSVVDDQLAEQQTHELDTQVGNEPPDTAMQEYQDDDFQALFFTVAGLTLAVPLKSLGGIHQLHKPSPLFGKPNWFLGMMMERDSQLQVVDTARWVMPEKYTPELAEKIDYQYLIMLGESKWGLACEQLVTSTGVSPDAVQWRRTETGKRPWLAGVVREKMCALLNVDALVRLLDKGLDSQQG